MNVHEKIDQAATPTTEAGTGGFWDFKQVNPTRSMVCFGLAALIGLGIAGFGLFTAKGTTTHLVPPENVALVNQRPILRTDFIAQTESELGKTFTEATMAERLKVLDEMVREELFVQRGLELDFPGTDPDTRTALVAAVEQQVVADVTTHTPTDAELQKYFEDNRGNYSTEGTMVLHDVAAPKGQTGPDAQAKLQKAADALRAHMPLEEVLKTNGLEEIVPPHASPEQFYFAQRFHLGDVLFDKVLTLNEGDVTEPTNGFDGRVHIVQLVKNTKPLPLTFERVRSQVLNDFIMSEKKRLEDSDLRYLRDKADILIADDYRAPYEKQLEGGGFDTEKTAKPAEKK